MIFVDNDNCPTQDGVCVHFHYDVTGRRLHLTLPAETVEEETIAGEKR